MSNYMNEAGEPYMTAAALNFEAALDEQSAWERANDPDAFYGSDYMVDFDCPVCGEPADERGCDNGCDPDDEPEDDTYHVDEDAAMEFGLFGSET